MLASLCGDLGSIPFTLIRINMLYNAKIQDCKINWIQHVNQMPHNRLGTLIKKLHPKRQKEPRKPFEETSGCVRPEWVNKWPNSLIAM
jgi:hypothetical protein